MATRFPCYITPIARGWTGRHRPGDVEIATSFDSRLRTGRRCFTSFLLLAGAAWFASGAWTVVVASPVPSRTSAPVKYELDVSVSDLTLGRNRFAFGLLANNHPVSVPTLRIQLFSITSAGATPGQTLSARFNDFARGLKNPSTDATATQLKGVYVSSATFRRAGAWGVQAYLPVTGGTQLIRQEFVVQRHGRTPAVGSPAPRSHNPTTAQVSVLKLDSGRPPNDMHRLSIAAAIALHRPLVVVFGSPGYCQSRICGPETEIVQRVEAKYRARVNFIHIETYKDADPARGPSATFVAWHLQTDPWVFVIDRAGVITAKFEGPTSVGEIETALATVVR